MRPISRRLLLSAAAAGGAAALVPGCSATPSSGQAQPVSTAPQPQAEPEKPRFVQIVAHQDDDILFMNPDVRDSIRSGNPTVTVFITAGENDSTVVGDVAAYAATRQLGSRAAYAMMADVADDWTGEALQVDDAHQVELYTLKAKPQIQLVFMNLPENADHLAVGGPQTLVRLWENKNNNAKAATLVPAGGKVTQAYTYTHATLVSVLTALLARFQPTVLRAQDQWPDLRYTNDAQWQPFHDHPDHVMAARFTDLAARAYRDLAAHPQLIQLNYRDYNLSEVPLDLSPEQQQAKVAYFAVYLKHDPQANPNPPYDQWSRSMYYRWPRGTSWVGRNADGRLQAFAVRSGELVTWQQQKNGSWTGPASVSNAGGALLPSVSVVSDGRGLMHVFARRLDNHSIVTIAQVAPNGGWAKDWLSLGNPNLPASSLQPSQVGVPAAATTGSGRLVIFVKNGGGGVSAKEQTTPGGDWRGAWTDLGGADVQDGLCAITTDDGRIELFASARYKVLHWSQPHPDQPFTPDATFPSKEPSGPPVAAKGANGRLFVFYRAGGMGAVVACSQDATSGQWAAPAFVHGQCGPGGPAVVSTGKGVDARLMLFGRNGGTGVLTTGQTDATAFGPWTDLGGDNVDYPTAAVAADGSVVVLGISPGGRLRVNHQNNATKGSPFTGWQTIGS